MLVSIDSTDLSRMERGSEVSRREPHIICIDYSSVSALADWKESLVDNLRRNGIDNPRGAETFSLLADQISVGNCCAYLALGRGIMVEHTWPNGEAKRLAAYNGRIYGENPYWLEKYPFLPNSADLYGSNTEYELHQGKRGASMQARKSNILCSHNGHYGHFCADDLPWLVAFRVVLDGVELEACGKSLQESLRKELENFKIRCPESDKSQLSTTYSIEYRDLIKGWIDDWALRSYLIKKHLHIPIRTRKKDNNTSERLEVSKRLFISRSDRHGSRIENYLEVSNGLRRNGFSELYLDGMSLDSVVKSLKGTAVIVAECGTTSMIASMCAQSYSLIISLQPEDLITKPNEEMKQSGLPYISYFHNNIAFFTGSVTSQSNVQSSSIANYPVQDLSDFIEEKIRQIGCQGVQW